MHIAFQAVPNMLRAYRIAIFSLCLILPLARFSLPQDAYDPMWLRGSLAFFFLLMGLSSFAFPFFKRHFIQVSYIGLYVFNVWAMFLVFQNNFPADYFANYLLSLVASAALFRHLWWLIGFIIGTFVVSLSFYPLLDQPDFSPPNFYLSEATALAIIVISNRRMLLEKDQLLLTGERFKLISRAAFDLSDAAIIVTDLEGHILQFNEVYLKMWGLSRQELSTGRKRAGDENLLAQMQNPETLNEGYHLALDDPNHELNQELVLLDGRYIHRHSKPLLAADIPIARIWFYRDITASKKEKQKLIEKREALSEQNQLLVKLAGSSAFDAKDLNQTLNEILYPGLQQLKAAQVSVWRMAPDEETLVNIYASGNPKAEASVGQTFNIKNHQFFFESLRHKRILAISNSEMDIHMDSFRQDYPDMAGRAQLDVPIREKGICTGLISFQCSAPIRPWSLEEMAFASSIGDITQLALEAIRRKEAEAEVFRSNAILNSVFERSGIGIAVTDAEARLLACNHTFVEMWGLTDEMVQPGNEALLIAKVISQIDGNQIDTPTAVQLVKELPHNRHYKIYLNDGRLVERYIGELDLGTEEKGRIWYYRDITLQTQQAEALRKSEERNRATLNAVPDLLVLMDDKGRIIDLKVPEDTVFQALQHRNFDRIEDLLPKSLSEKVRIAAATVLATGEMHSLEAQIDFLGAERDLELRILLSGKSELLLILRDATSLKSTERELLQRNFELDSFVYRASHDLKAPLNSLMGLIDILRSDSPPPKILTYISLMDRSVQKLDTFIRNLTDFSRITRLEIDHKEVPLEPLLQEINESLRYMDDADRVELQFEIEQQIPFQGDRFHLGIVLSNLISNAIKYQDHSKTASWVKVQIMVKPREVHFVISDNGIGIPREHQDRLFELFYRASNQSFGSGLGLYITKNAVEKMGGAITLNSEAGEGTEFRFFIQNHLQGPSEEV